MLSNHQVEVDGVNFNYSLAGNGKTILLLLPGALGSSKSDFTPQLENFNRDKFTLVSLDFRGYGLTRPPQRDFPKDFYYRDARDALNVMKALGHEKYSVLGWSDGGNCGCIMAATAPQTIDKLCVWGSNSFVTPEELESYKSIRDVSKWSEKMRAPMVEQYGYEYFELLWHGWVDSFFSMDRVEDDRSIDLYKKELEKIEAETLIIHGMKDRLVPMFQTDYLKDKIKNSRLVIWDDGSHNLHLRFHERFQQLIEDFLDGKCTEAKL